MALYGGQRDVSLIRRLNRELVNRYIDIEVALYKLNLQSTRTNIYNESTSKRYYNPIRLHSLITRDARSGTGDDYGIDTTRTATFAFFKPDLIDKNVVVEVGDIIEFDNTYYEVDNISVAQEYFAGKDESTDKGFTLGERGSFGFEISVIAECHVTKLSSIQTEPIRSGINRPNNVPRNI
jgi:hypothetical protein